LAQDLVHRLPLCKLTDEFVQIANLAHERVFDLFHAQPADNAFDKRSFGIELRRVGKESLEVAFDLDLVPKFCLGLACQPADDAIDFLLRAVLAFCLLNVHWVNANVGFLSFASREYTNHTL